MIQVTGTQVVKQFTVTVNPLIKEIRVTATPATVTNIRVVGSAGVAGTTGSRIYNETPTGILNGINNIFTSLLPFIPETIEVFANGILQKKIEEYNTSGNNEIILTFSPLSTEKITINYNVTL